MKATRIFFGASLLALCMSCSSLTKSLLKDPEVQVTGVDVADVSSKDITLRLKLNVQNPNPVEINLKKVSYALDFSGRKVTEGTFNEGINVPASGQGDVVIPLKFEYNALGSVLDGFLKKTLTKEYELKGSAQFGIFTIPFTKKGEVKLNR